MMGKRFLFCVILMLLCLFGCEQGELSTEPLQTVEQTQPTVQTTVPEPTQCKHEDLIATFIRKETYLDYGGSCEDPTHVYNQCRDCGEFVFVRDEPSELKCVYTGVVHTVIKEVTCTEDGIYTFICQNCEKVRERTKPSKGHQYYWFWGEDTPRCSGCSLLQEDFSNHEYELTFSTEPQGYFPGKRYYQCKICEKEKVECFDKYGDYDLQTAKNAILRKLQDMGFQVLEYYDLLPNTIVYEKHKMLVCNDTNSKQATQQLIDMSDDLIKKLVSSYDFGQEGVNPADYYAWVDVSYVSNSIASGFVITIYARGTFWEI